VASVGFHRLDCLSTLGWPLDGLGFGLSIDYSAGEHMFYAVVDAMNVYEKVLQLFQDLFAPI
jgi:hypothetical protein